VNGGGAESLEEVLAREGTLAPARVAEIIYQLAAQLDAARLAGRDYGGIAPALIMIGSAPGRPDTAHVPDYLMYNAIEMTPEQRARKAQRALVAVAVQMLTGASLVPTEPVWEQVTARGLPPAAASVLIAALAERTDGFASFAEFAGALARSLGAPLGDRPPPGQAAPRPSAAQRAVAGWARRRSAARDRRLAAASQAKAAVQAKAAPSQAKAAGQAKVAAGFAIAVLIGGGIALAVTAANHAAGPRVTPAPAAAPGWRGWPGAPVVSALHPASRVIVPYQDILAVHDTLAVSPDGTRLIAVESHGNATEVNLLSGTSSRLPSLSTDISPDALGIAVAVSPDLSTLAGAGSAGVETQSAVSGEPLGSLSVSLGTASGPWAIGFSPDSKTLAFGDDNGAIRLANLATNESTVLRSPDGVASYDPDALAFSPDGKTLAVSTGTNDISLWDVASGTRITTLSVPSAQPAPYGAATLYEGVTALAFGEAGALLAAGDDNGNVYLWDVARQRLLGALAGSPAEENVTTFQVAFSPDGGLIAASFANGTVGVWSAATGRRLAVLPEACKLLTDPIAFALGGRVLVNVGAVGDLTQWRLR
jgi:hypothetical protein